MTIEKYQELSGITLPQSRIAAVTAQIRRTRNMLETMLGYSLKKEIENFYEEKGKATNEFSLCGFIRDINEATLDAPDEVIGSYRLFDYNAKDVNFKVDPFTQVHAVKLVFVKIGDEPNGITHKTFDDDLVRVHKTGKISKYIERCRECFCSCQCKNACVQLAVDADWLNEDCLPEDLLYVWVDMVTYYGNCKVDIKRETLGTHTYEKFDRKPAEEVTGNLAVLKRYAGPNGSLSRTVTI